MISRIVHWKEVVGDEWLPEFERTTKALLFAEQQGRYREAWAKLSDETKEKYLLKRDLMRKAGYTLDDEGNFSQWEGWYGWAELTPGGLRFKTTALPDREYITLGKFLDFKKGLDQAAIEDEYYGAPDPDFPPEDAA